MRPNRKMIAAAAGLCAIAVNAPASATSLQKLNLEALVEQSKSVIVGEAKSSRTERTDQGVMTYTEFQVKDEAFGDAGATVTVTTLGGRYQIGKFKLAETWPGSPTFSSGERVVLFLQDSRFGEAEIVGYSQGAINVVETGSGEAVRSPDGDMEALPSFMQRVRNIKSRGRVNRVTD